jgi:Mor family transcriptional regulator
MHPIDSNATLPSLLQDIANTIGFDAAMKLVERFGGTRIYVPRPQSMAWNHPLSEALGSPDAVRLAHAFQGEAVEIPLATDAQRFRRDVEIVSAYSQGATQRELAQKYRTSERNVRKILSRMAHQRTPVRAASGTTQTQPKELERA